MTPANDDKSKEKEIFDVLAILLFKLIRFHPAENIECLAEQKENEKDIGLFFCVRALSSSLFSKEVVFNQLLLGEWREREREREREGKKHFFS